MLNATLRHKGVLRENSMLNRCVRKDSSSCDPSYITRDRSSRVIQLGSGRGVHPYARVNHTVFFSCHGFIKFMYINKILMKTRLWFFIILRVTKWTTLYPNQWIWILPVGLDFASGPGLPVDLDMKTPWARLPAISCDSHNHGIRVHSQWWHTWTLKCITNFISLNVFSFLMFINTHWLWSVLHIFWSWRTLLTIVSLARIYLYSIRVLIDWWSLQHVMENKLSTCQRSLVLFQVKMSYSNCHVKGA